MKTPLLHQIGLVLFCLLASSSTLLAQNLNLALGKTAIASSLENGSFPASSVTDGNHNTRWSSAFADPQNIVVDLGSTQVIDRIRLSWEAAYGRDFKLQVSDDGVNYTTVRDVVGNAPENRNGQLVNEYTNLAARGQYVRMLGTARATQYGFSIFEFEVFSFSSTVVSLGTGRPAQASNTQANFTPDKAFDGDANTRWSTLNTTNQELVVDLGGMATISRIYLNWEAAYGVNFQLQASNDGSIWTTFATFTNNQVYYNELGVFTTGRYIRMFGQNGGQNAGGFSIYELNIFGTVAPLPVSLTSFTAVPQGKAVAVDWTTATELNNAGFEVQRSANGLDFNTLAKVDGAGNSQLANTYHYLDAAPLATLAYYRLQQIDFDGKAVYSPVVAVQAAGRALATLSVYPNPTAERATLEWDALAASPVQWHLTNSLGQLVHTETLAAQAGHNAQAIDLQPYAAGSYVLTVEAAGQVLGRTRVQKNN